MGLELKQNLRLSQQLVMTPQLQQAIKLLQLSRMELVDLIRTEVEQNPLLEDSADAQQNEIAETPVEQGAVMQDATETLAPPESSKVEALQLNEKEVKRED